MALTTFQPLSPVFHPLAPVVPRLSPSGFVVFVSIGLASFCGGAEPGKVQLNWLSSEPPATDEGVSWGVPWAKGELGAKDLLVLNDAKGHPVPVQTWPLAFWPDGTVKWSGQAVSNASELSGRLQLSVSNATVAATRPINTMAISSDEREITIDTGKLRARISKAGESLIASLVVGDREVARNGKLILRLEDRSRYASEQILREENFTSLIESAVVEQSGPVRTVVKITGKHKSTAGERTWLPFSVRLYFFADSGAIRLTHSFVFDGDGEKDFIKGIGLSFSVPLKEELHNRHMRFVGDGSGVWAQPVRMLPGYRSQTGATIEELYAPHLAGKRAPNIAEFDDRTSESIMSVPVWGDAKLTQLGPNGWSIFKRTTAKSSWLHVTDGQRARGLAVLADVSGGLAVGVRDFWQKSPSSFEITNAETDLGELKIWLWSPEADAMDLRHYDTGPHGLNVNYEDWKPGWATPLGIANSHDLILWAFAAIPTNDQLVAMARAASEPPKLVCTPEYYHKQHVFGYWSLPDRSTPARRWVEDQVQGLVDFYRGQVDERSWYGFWDYGDIMHNYDFGRHEWRYDVGGWAWANTELMPDMLLWYSFLRTGRADIFRMAEAMTRHTSEVDVHHLGPFAPLGSRHNVNHWGDGAKQPRVSHSGLKQFYYFLTTDERVGDLMHEQLEADLTYAKVQQFNSSHYVRGADGKPQLDGRARTAAPPPGNLGETSARRAVTDRLSLEWMCYAMNWAMEWQRTGDLKWRDRITGDMRAMTVGLDANGRLPGRYFDMIFGGPENMFEMEPLFAEVPEFWRAWSNTCQFVGEQADGGQMTGPRLLAYAAHTRGDPQLGRMAWDKLIGDHSLAPAPIPHKVEGSSLVHPVTDPAFLGAPVGWQLHGVASVQWALNAIETLELAGDFLGDWEKEHPVNKK